MIAVGGNEITKAFVADTEIDKMYLGSVLVYSKGPETLPYDAEIEYIEGSGTQWIDTLITPDSNTKIQVKLMNKEVSGNVILGYYIDSDTSDYRLFNYNNKIYFDVYSQRVTGVADSLRAGFVYNFELGNNYVKNLDTGTTLLSGTVITFTGLSTIRINNALGINNNSKNRIYYLKLYNGDNVVRDFIPVRIGQTGALYDKISKRLFENSGSGSFICGNDLVQEYDAQVEYLENTSTSNGASYFDSGFTPSTNTRIVLNAYVNSYTNQTRCFYVFKTPLRLELYINGSNKYAYNFNTSDNNVTTNVTPVAGNTTFDIDGVSKNINITVNQTVKVNAAITKIPSTYTSSEGTLHICGRYDTGCLVGKLYSCQIYENGVLVRNFIPVRVGQIGYFYDTVNKKFHSNCGSSAWQLGPDV